MQAIILAAGMGKRLKELTQNNTKCMVKVNGVSLIDRLLHQLEKQHLSRIVIVVGYEGQKLIDYIATLGIKTPISYVDNAVYDKTNNIYSLALAKNYLMEEDTLLFESDVIIEDSAIDELVKDPRDTLAMVDKYESWMDGTCVKLDEYDNIVAFVPGKSFDFKEKEEYYKTVNIYKFSKHFSQDIYVPFLEAYCSALGENEYYEQVLRVITMLDTPGIKGMRLSGQKWYEIDDEQDLDIATTLFAPDDETRINLMHKRYGGFWRYPGLLDFCYLVNPYYPPKKLKDELRASFDTLLTEYPSGMGVNSLLAAKNFGVHKDNIIVGNGAAELIKSLMESFSGKTGVIRPTFEEYPNRYSVEDEVVFTPSNDNYTYSVEELIEFYTCNKVDNIIIINPDNPSGNYLKKEEIIRLIKWTDGQGIKLVVDESFADFSDEPDNSLIEQKFIETYRRLYVMKSISKSYGVPGLRLGILVSSDTEAIAAMKKDVAIWNINSFGEYYLQIAEKYKKDYAAAMDKFRVERKRFYNELEQISGIRVIPSQANYFMIEITNGMTAKELMIKLFKNHYLLIKDLTSKLHDGKQYIRIAIRNDVDNNKMIEALKKETFDIDVRFGLEVCYTPETESLLSSILKNYHFDFLIGSVHSVDGYLYDMDAFSKELLWNKNDPSNIYKSYYDAIEKLIQSNLFDQVGHPDVIKLYSIDPGYDLHPTYHHIARLANEYKIKMEDNTKAHYSYHHPDIGLNADFRNILKENNVQIVTASDAHYPNDVGRCFELLDPR